MYNLPYYSKIQVSSVKNQDYSQSELKINSLCKYCADAQILFLAEWEFNMNNLTIDMRAHSLVYEIYEEKLLLLFFRL